MGKEQKDIKLWDGTVIPGCDIVGRECKHVVYTEANDGSRSDCLLVKEQIHLKDNRRIPNVYEIVNYKRPYFITKPGYRTYKDKTEFEDLNKVQQFRSTQIDLGRNIARSLGTNNGQLPLRQILRSPYVFGCDTTTPVLVKNAYQQRYPECKSDNDVAALDIETDVVNGDGDEIIMIGITNQTESYVCGVRSFYGTKVNIEAQFHAKCKEYIGEYVDPAKLKVDFELFDTPIECIKATFARLHKWKPDFVSIWNMNFDLPKIISQIERAGHDVASIFNDPLVQPKFNNAKYRQGPSKKKTATGKEMSLHPADQWHTMNCMASFYFIDAMCVYKRIRVAGGMQPSYALDFILNKHLGVRKLKFTEADGLNGLQWHQFLQANYPIEYTVYNLFDTIALIELDRKTRDLAQVISVLTDHSEYARFPSTPRRLSDDMEFFAQEHGRVFGTTADIMEDELDQYVLPMTNWIVTLPAELVVDSGIHCIKDIPNMSTKIYVHVADLDVEGAYPWGETIMNISKETTWRELSRLEGIPDEVQRRNGINLTGGHTNAVQFCNEIYGLPTFTELKSLYVASKNNSVVNI